MTTKGKLDGIGTAKPINVQDLPFQRKRANPQKIIIEEVSVGNGAKTRIEPYEIGKTTSTSTADAFEASHHKPPKYQGRSGRQLVSSRSHERPATTNHRGENIEKSKEQSGVFARFCKLYPIRSFPIDPTNPGNTTEETRVTRYGQKIELMTKIIMGAEFVYLKD